MTPAVASIADSKNLTAVGVYFTPSVTATLPLQTAAIGPGAFGLDARECAADPYVHVGWNGEVKSPSRLWDDCDICRELSDVCVEFWSCFNC